MSATILSGKTVSEHMILKLTEESRLLREKGIIPRLAILRVGDDMGSVSYEKSIIKRMAASEIEVESIVFSEDVTQDEFLAKLSEVNGNELIHSILIFKPLPPQLDEEVIKYAISPAKDPDAMNPTNLGKLMIGDNAGFFPCTAEGVMKLLEYYEVDLKGKDVVIINNSAVVGKPLAMMMTNEFATVTMCHVYTKDVKSYTQKADIVVTAVGKYGLVNADMLSEDAILVDVAMSTMKDDDANPVLDEKGKKVRAGDAHVDCLEKAKMVTSATPGLGGGTGPITTALLGEHVIKAAKLQSGLF